MTVSKQPHAGAAGGAPCCPVEPADSGSLLSIPLLQRFLRASAHSAFIRLALRLMTAVTHIGQIERMIGSVVVVLDPWCSPTCLTRMWCLYEIVHAQSHADANLALTMAPSERSDFLRVMQKEGSAMCTAQLGFDARKASATIESDRVAIFALIAERFGHGRDDDGIELFNSQVRMAIQRALAAFSWAVATAPAPPRALVLGSFTGSRRRSFFPNFAVHPEQPPQSRTALHNTAPKTDGADAVTSCDKGALNTA